MALHFARKLKEMLPVNSLKYLLHDHLSGLEPARPLKNVHASALTKPGEVFCPRYYALSDLEKTKPKDEWVDTASILTWDMGRDLQDRVVGYFADMGRAIGHWRCHSCNKMYEFCKRPQKCECGAKNLKPEEVRFESAISGASCGIDMLVNVGEPKLVIVEIKTMLKDQFKDLVAPLSEHRHRTNLYLRLAAESDHSWSNMVNTEKAIILYTCKGGYTADPQLKQWGLYDSYSPFKEFPITRNDAQTDDLNKQAKVVKDFREGVVGVPCGVCASAISPRAKKCGKKEACFSGDYPPKYDWINK